MVLIFERIKQNCDQLISFESINCYPSFKLLQSYVKFLNPRTRSSSISRIFVSISSLFLQIQSNIKIYIIVILEESYLIFNQHSSKHDSIVRRMYSINRETYRQWRIHFILSTVPAATRSINTNSSPSRETKSLDCNSRRGSSMARSAG